MQSGRLVWGQNEDRNIERDLKGGKINSIHPAKEGFIYLQAPTEDFWKSLCELIGLSSLSQDPRYDSMKKRKENEEILLPMLHAALQKKTALEWEQHFGDRVPCSAVRSIEDMFDHPQVLSQGLISTHAHPTLGSYQTMTGPVQMANGESDLADRRAPMLGEHTDEILKEFDFSDLEISAFKKSQAIH
jgi:formyl-CoA transferase